VARGNIRKASTRAVEIGIYAPGEID